MDELVCTPQSVWEISQLLCPHRMLWRHWDPSWGPELLSSTSLCQPEYVLALPGVKSTGIACCWHGLWFQGQHRTLPANPDCWVMLSVWVHDKLSSAFVWVLLSKECSGKRSGFCPPMEGQWSCLILWVKATFWLNADYLGSGEKRLAEKWMRNSTCKINSLFVVRLGLILLLTWEYLESLQI